jgi:hypothetical protein
MVELRVVWGDPIPTLKLLGQSISYIERTHLTMRLFNGRLVRKTLAFSKDVGMYRASAAWEHWSTTWPGRSKRYALRFSMTPGAGGYNVHPLWHLD